MPCLQACQCPGPQVVQGLKPPETMFDLAAKGQCGKRQGMIFLFKGSISAI